MAVRAAGPHADVSQDLLNDLGLLDHRDDSNGATVLRTHSGVNLANLLDEMSHLRPKPWDTAGGATSTIATGGALDAPA